METPTFPTPTYVLCACVANVLSNLWSLQHCKLTLLLPRAETLKWSCPRVGGVSPPPLAAHGCAVVGTAVYVFGGLSPVYPGAGDALYCLNTGTHGEVNVPPLSVAISSRTL